MADRNRDKIRGALTWQGIYVSLLAWLVLVVAGLEIDLTVVRKSGASMKMWRWFFPRATIVGLDIEDKTWLTRGHIHTYLGDQTEFRVQTDLAGELVVRRQNATGAAGDQGLGPGDEVRVRWHEDANLVLVD